MMVSVRKELAEHGLAPRKRWGQHFLFDRNILNKVVQTAQVEEGDVILEVGPGLGLMTSLLASRGKKVIAVEIDQALVEILKKKLGSQSNVEIIPGDILTLDFNALSEKEGRRIKVIANLPYQITTPLLFRFIDSKDAFSSFTLMLQKEVAERLTAKPHRKDYGPLSIFIQMESEVSIRFLIRPSSFFPRPRVDSAVIHMVWRKKPLVAIQGEEWFKRVVKGCFSYRRKNLMNALKHSGLPLPEDLEGRMRAIGISPHQRPETLTIHEFVHLAETLRPSF